MVKHSFKIGDKVKYTGHIYDGVEGKTGIIIVIRGDCISVRYNTDICVVCGDPDCQGGKTDTLWSKLSEIEHATRVGQQLLFNFMTP